MMLSPFDLIQWQIKFVVPSHKIDRLKHILVSDLSHLEKKKLGLQSKLARDKREGDGSMLCLVFLVSNEAEEGSSGSCRPPDCLFMKHFDSFVFKTHHSWKGRKGQTVPSTLVFCQTLNSNNEPVRLACDPSSMKSSIKVTTLVMINPHRLSIVPAS